MFIFLNIFDRDFHASLCEKYLNYVKGHLAQQNEMINDDVDDFEEVADKDSADKNGNQSQKDGKNSAEATNETNVISPNENGDNHASVDKPTKNDNGSGKPPTQRF